MSKSPDHQQPANLVVYLPQGTTNITSNFRNKEPLISKYFHEHANNVASQRGDLYYLARALKH